MDILTYFYISLLLLFLQIYFIFKRFNSQIVVLDFLGILANLQWFLAPVLIQILTESGDVDVNRYYQNLVPQYPFFALTCLLGLILGLEIGRLVFPVSLTLMRSKLIFLKNISQRIKNQLLIFGLSCTFLSSYAGDLRFIFVSLGDLFFVFLILSFISDDVGSKVVFYSALLLYIFTTLASGMFGPIFIWAIVITNYYSILKPLAFWKKFSMVFFGMVILVLLQTVKEDYRRQTWNQLETNGSQQNVAELAKLLDESQASNNITSILPTLYRLNQGYLVSRVMENVPRYIPFQNGATILEDIGASLIPRFVWSDKPKSGGKRNVEIYAGMQLSGGTSMNIGQIGESWVNFGFASPLFLFGYTFLLRYGFSLIVKRKSKLDFLVVLLPLFVIHVISVETDFLTTFNALIKVSFMIYLVNRLLVNNLKYS